MAALAVAALAAVVLCAVGAPLGAQAVRGAVVHADGAPASGVVALLLRASNDSIVARAITATRGAYLLRAPSSGEYRLRFLRLGQQPETIGPFSIGARESVEHNVVLVNRPITLARFDVRSNDECRTRPDTGLLVAQLLGEARKALLASVATSLDGESLSELETFTRVEDTRQRLVAKERTQIVTRSSANPFSSLSADSLAKIGYVLVADDSVIYRAPDAEALLSDAFAARHCFQVVEGSGERAASIGVAFRPVSVPSGLVEIRGTIWMERKTGALQSVAFTYDPIPEADRRAGVGGDVDFLRTASGLWIVQRWNIRMPRAVIKEIPGIAGTMPTPPRSVRSIEGILRTGGDARTVRVGAVLHYARGLSSSVVASATVSTQDVPAAPVTQHPVCGTVGVSNDSGAVAGRVSTDNAQGIAGVTVVARWRNATQANSSGLASEPELERRATTDSGGEYVLCGLPLDKPLTMFVTRNESRSGTTSLRVTGDTPVATSNLVVTQAFAAALDAPAMDSTKARLRLRVRRADGTSVPDAEVTVRAQAVTRSVRSDNDGDAYFLDLAPGVIEVGVRRIGSAATTMRAAIEPGRNELAIQLAGSTVVLEAVRVIGGRDVSARHAVVDDRILRGEASAVVTRRDIERRAPIKLSQMLRGMPGIRMVDSSGATLAISSRGQRLSTGPDGIEPAPCVLRVMVDGILSSAATDIDQVVPGDVYAVEVFYGAARIPQQFAGIRNVTLCGLIAIWTR